MDATKIATGSKISQDLPTKKGPPDTDNCLPPYSETATSVEDDLLQPETLLLAGNAIHSTSSPPSCSIPIYQPSRDISHLRQSNTKVEFFRFDYHIRNRSTTTNTPKVGTQEKHIFNLTRPPTVTFPTFEYHLESVSKSNLGHVGLKRYHHLFSSGFQAWRAALPRAGANLEAQELIFVAKSRGKERFEWRDSSNRLVAHDTVYEGIFRLQIVEIMSRKQRDALVGVWCLRVWREIANSNMESLHWEDVKRILQTCTTEFPNGTGGGMPGR